MRLCFTFFSSLFLSGCGIIYGADIPVSVAERSGFTRTATEAEVDEILAATAAADSRMARWTMGESNEGRPIQALKIGWGPEGADDDRMTVVIIGGIHSGECAGKEALFDITRAMVAGQHAGWLEQMRLVVVPSLSPDSNSQRAVDNRPGQIGPVDGMGVRPNAQGLDLNRDFVKLESPEIRSLVAAMNQYDADVLIDLHTTNGSQHRYELTYDPPHHPMTPSLVREFLRGELLPTITEKAADKGISLFYYGNFDRSHSRWTTYGYEGRYSTNYMGLRGKLGILSEAYSYATYPKRIEASRVFVEEVLNYLTANRDEVRQVLETESRIIPGAEVALTARLDAFPESVKVRGYRPDPADEGLEREDYDYEVQFFGDFQTDISEPLPSGYFIAGKNDRIAELLELHGIKFERRELSDGLSVEAYEISECAEADRPFQGHKMVRLSGRWQPANGVETGEGIWVDCRQPLAALVAVILQPESVDSIATWNVIPVGELQPGMTFPVLRVRAE